MGSVIDWASIMAHLGTDVVSAAIYLASAGIIKVLATVTTTIFGKPSIDAPWSRIGRPTRFGLKGEPVYTDARLFEGRKGEIDAKATLAKSDFPIPPEELVLTCKAFMASGFGSKDGTLIADDFLFCPPVVMPLNKDDFLRIFGSFKLTDALPDLCENAWNFHVDPMEPNRVWWLSRNVGTHTGHLPFGPGFAPTGKKIVWPVQANSMLFNERKQCYQLTVGYSCDKQVGNTGGLGAVFGLLHAIGHTLPILEGKPWQPSPVYRLLTRVGAVGEKLGFGPGR